MFREVLAERVVKHRKRYPPIHKGIALTALALVALCLLTICVLLLIFMQPPDTYTYTVHHLGPEVDVQETLKHCERKPEITVYGDAGRFIGSSLYYGDVYIREKIHPDDIAKRIRTMRCGPPADVASVSQFYSFGGSKATTENIANVCMEPLPGAADGTWGPGDTKELLRRAPLYMVETSDTLPNTCDMILLEMQLPYKQTFYQKNVDPVMMGIQCFMHGPMELLGLRPTANEVRLYFGWPLQKGKGLVEMKIMQYCTHYDDWTARFLEVLSSREGNRDIGALKSELMGRGIPISPDPTSPWLTSLHAREDDHGGDTLVVTKVDGPYREVFVASVLGYEVPADLSLTDPPLPYGSATEEQGNFTRSSLHGIRGLVGLARMCKNRTNPFKEADIDLDSAIAGILALYKNLKFSYECAEKNPPTWMTRLSYIWPMLSLAYTIVGIYIARVLYKSMFQAGTRCCGAQGEEVHKDEDGAGQGLDSQNVASQGTCKETDDDDDKYAELEARMGSRIGSLEAHIRNLESALESSRSSLMASLNDLQTLQRNAQVAPVGEKGIDAERIDELHRRLDMLSAKRLSSLPGKRGPAASDNT